MTPFAIECRLPEPARRVAPPPACEPGRVPRVARWLALAIRLEAAIAAGAIADAASAARAWKVSRARVSHVLNLALLAPAIQEAILFLPRVTAGRDTVTLGDLQPVALTPDWADQRKLFGKLRAANGF